MPAPTVARDFDPALKRSYVDAGLWGYERLRDGLELWADRTPARTAVVDNTVSATYADLEATVARAVARLRYANIGLDSAVMVVVPVSAAAVAAYLAVVRTGATVVLLDRRCGPADVQHAADPIDLDLVIGTPESCDRLGLADLGPSFLSLETLLSEGPVDRSWAEPDPAAPAAVFFTSGTTDRPKSVIHTLDTLRSGARNMAATLGFAQTDAAFLSSPVASITGIMQVHLAVERGGALVLEDRFSPAQSLRRVIDNNATVLGGAPVIAEELFKEARRHDLAELPIRAIALGGAMIPRDLLELAVTRWGIVPSRVYGSSEAPMSTYTLPGDRGDGRLSDDGALPPGAEVRIDDSGEVLLRGPMLFRGYLHDEDNTAAFSEGGWFRTGDLGRIDGNRLTIVGRLKEVAVRKGLKISLPEIDAAARALPGVDEAASYAVSDPDTGERLALAVSTAAGRDLTFESVTEALLAAGLAKWKLPEEVVVWESPLPRTETGKIQRRRLGDKDDLARRMLADRLRTTPKD